MWNKKAVPAVEPSPAERLRIAGDQVTLTTGAITRLREEYAAYQRAHDLVMDGAVPVYFSATTGEEKQTIHNRIIDFRERSYALEQKFYQALREHDALQEEVKKNATNNSATT